MSKPGKSPATLALITEAIAILDGVQPCSVRAVCYRLFVKKLIPDMSKNSTNRVGSALTWARENGLIPWAWIVDETRRAETPGTWQNPSQIIDAAVEGYRRDRWQDQSKRVEAWSEKGTIRGTLAPILHQYGVTFRVMHGFASATSLNDAAEFSNYSDTPLTILYLGDHDPSGLRMSESDLPDRLERYGGNCTIERIALTRDDCTGLPGFDVHTKTGDPNYQWYVTNYGDTAWELDAMPPDRLRDRVAAAIRTRLDMDAWDRAGEVEDAETESMREFLATWKRRAAHGTL